MSAPLAAEQAAALQAAGLIRVTWRDDSLPHQMRLYMIGQDIAVSCNCMRGVDGTAAHYSPLEVRGRWEAAEAQAVYRAHLAEEAVPA
jgi:hypothetical protein